MHTGYVRCVLAMYAPPATLIRVDARRARVGIWPLLTNVSDARAPLLNEGVRGPAAGTQHG